MFKELVEIYKSLNVDRAKRHDDFRVFHKELIDLFGAELGARIGTLAQGRLVVPPRGKENKYGLEISITDLIWWDDEIKKSPTIVLRPIEEIRDIVYADIVKRLEGISGRMGDDKTYKKVLELYEQSRSAGSPS